MSLPTPPLPSALNLGTVDGYNLRLVAGATTLSGKTFYFWDRNGTGAADDGDRITYGDQYILDRLFNGGKLSSDDGSVVSEGVDTSRTVVLADYTLVLPNLQEIQELYADPLPNPPTGWYPLAYWTSTFGLNGTFNRFYYYLDIGYGNNNDDGVTRSVTFYVLKNVTYQLSHTASSVDEGGQASFRLVTTGVTAGTVLNYTLSGVSSADIVGGALTGSVSVGSDGTATIKVPINADRLSEGPETLSVAIAGTSASASMMINDTSNTLPTYSIKANGTSVNEGQSASFNLSTTNVAAGSVLPYTLSGISATDVTSGSLTGVTAVDSNGQATIFIPVTADKLFEGSETMTVSLQNSLASIVINDTSVPVIPTYRLSSTFSSINEGAAASFVLATTDVAGGTVLPYTLSGVSSTDIINGSLSGTVSVGANANGTTTVLIPIALDEATEGPEVLTISIQGVSASTTINDTSQTLPTSGILYSNNFDSSFGSNVTVEGNTRIVGGAAYFDGEGDGLLITDSRLSGVSTSDFSVGFRFKSDGTQDPYSVLVSKYGTSYLEIANGMTAHGGIYGEISSGGVYPARNYNDGQWHTVLFYRKGGSVSLSVDGVSLGTTKLSSGTQSLDLTGIRIGRWQGNNLTDNNFKGYIDDLVFEKDPKLPQNNPTYSLSSIATSVNEGSTASFTLTTTGVAAGTILNYNLSGISSADIVGGSLTGSVSVGSDGTATIFVPIAADLRSEGPETLSVSIQGTTTAATTVINDTSVPTSYQLASTTSSVNEGNSASFRLSTTGVAAGTILNYNLSGISSADIVGGSLTGSVSVGGDGTATIFVPIAADLRSEGPETLSVSIQGTTTTATTVINDTSLPPIYSYSVSSNASLASPVVEGDDVIFTITRNTSGTESIVYVSTAAGSASAAGGDYRAFNSGNDRAITFGPDETTKTIAITTLSNDGSYEPADESFNLYLWKTGSETTSNLYVVPPHASALSYIRDPIGFYNYSLSTNAGAYSPTMEGGEITVTVTRTASNYASQTTASTVYVSTLSGSASALDFEQLDRTALILATDSPKNPLRSLKLDSSQNSPAILGYFAVQSKLTMVFPERTIGLDL